jgi:protease-4
VADSIFALPNTLTGSIGVFTLLFDAQKLFNDKLGINFDGVSTGTYADFGNIARPMSAFERQVAQRDVDSIYSTFKGRVMSGRKLNGPFVDSIAQGRVWSGTDALSIGLVDRIGSLKDAVACAARMAKLKKFSTREYPKRQTIFDKILSPEEDTETKTMNLVSKQLSPKHAAWLKEYHSITRIANVPQARLPFVIQLP